MTTAHCPVCLDRGVVRVGYQDQSPTDFGVCLCAVGLGLRKERNGKRPTVPYFHVWAAQRYIAVDRVCPIEDLLEDETVLATIPRERPADVQTIAGVMRTGKP